MPAPADGSQNGSRTSPGSRVRALRAGTGCWIVTSCHVFPWIYNTNDPEFIGVPFFYWYQMAWVPISVLITVFVYRATTERKPR